MSETDADGMPIGTNRATELHGPVSPRRGRSDLTSPTTEETVAARESALHRDIRRVGERRPRPRDSVEVRPQVRTEAPTARDEQPGARPPRPPVPVADEGTPGLVNSQESDPTEVVHIPPAGPAAVGRQGREPRAAAPLRRPILSTDVPSVDLRDATPDALDAAAARVEPLVLEPSAFSAAPWWTSGYWQLADGRRTRDLACDAGVFGSLAATAVSLRGNKHRLQAAPNDDAMAIRPATAPDGTRWLITCVCDGVGSATRSSIGSAHVADGLVEDLATLIRSGTWTRTEERTSAISRAIDVVIGGARSIAADLKVPIEELETTLTFAVVAADAAEDDSRTAQVGWVGDSPALILSDGRWHAVDPTAGDAGDAVAVTSTRTNGLLTSGRLDGILDVEIGPDQVLLLCTDGIGGFIGAGDEPLLLGSTLATHLAQPTDVLRVINLFSFELRSADDDRTAVVVWPLGGPVS